MPKGQSEKPSTGFVEGVANVGKGSKIPKSKSKSYYSKTHKARMAGAKSLMRRGGY